MSAEQLRRAADAMAADPTWRPVAYWLRDEADGIDRMVETTTRPSAGVDEPPAIFYGELDKAIAHANTHPAFYHANRVARAYLGQTS